MTTTPDSCSAGLVTALVHHLGESVRGLLPSGLALMTAGLEVALVRRGPDGAPRTVRRFSAQSPTSQATPPAELAVLLLTQLQREVGRHLGRPWPTNSDGVALQPGPASGSPGFRRSAPATRCGCDWCPAAPEQNPRRSSWPRSSCPLRPDEARPTKGDDTARDNHSIEWINDADVGATLA